MSFTNFHKRRFGIPASDFLRGFLCEHEVQLHHLPPNAVLQLASFVAMCEAFLGIAPNKNLFLMVFEVKTHKAHGSDGSVLAPVGGMNLQTCQGVCHSYSRLPLKTSNSGWHNHWFYIHDDATAPSPLSLALLR